MLIIRMPKNLGAEITVWHYEIVDNYSRDIDNLLEERVNSIGVVIAKVRPRKATIVSMAKKLFRKHIAAKERLAKPKSKRLSIYVSYNIKEVESDIDIEEVI